jgi:hypothetical protein
MSGRCGGRQTLATKTRGRLMSKNPFTQVTPIKGDKSQAKPAAKKQEPRFEIACDHTCPLNHTHRY